MKVILVPTADRPECGYALDAAFDLAHGSEGAVVGCHVRPHRADDPEFHTGSAEAARRLFESTAERHGFALANRPRLGGGRLALWRELVGDPGFAMAILGPTSDVTVLSRPKPKSSGRARQFLLATLYNSVRPVLVLPQRAVGDLLRNVVIAWNQSAESAAAVSAALPLLHRAARITILAAGQEDRPGPKSTHLGDYLKLRGLKADRVSTKGRNAEAEIEDAFRDVGGSLLVMGAYSRPRLAQRVFGGVTEKMLFQSNLPVFLLHR